MEKTHFISQVYDYLYPAKNRVVAAVAFVRTFKQTLTGAFTVGGTGLVAINAQDIANLNWEVVGWTVLAIVLSAILSASVAFDDVSRNGLNSKYMDVANPVAPAVMLEPAQVAKIGGQLIGRPSNFVPAPNIPADAIANVTNADGKIQIGVAQDGVVEETPAS